VKYIITVYKVEFVTVVSTQFFVVYRQ